jgi:hypothetical protein
MLARLVAGGAVLVAFAAPSAASAQQPALQPLARCYVSVSPTAREPISVNATGFMPYASVGVFIDDVQQAQAQADAAGTVTGMVDAPFVAEGQRAFTLRLTHELSDPSQNETVFAVSKVTALSVTQTPVKPKETSDKVRFRGRGFTKQTAAVYAHYVYGGIDRRTVRVAKPYGDCGLFSVRRRQFPFKHDPRPGVWTVQFDQQPTYSPQAPLFATLKITVKRTVGGH